MNDMSMSLEQYVKKNKKRKIWHRITSSVAALVVFVTTYMLILPAITIEDDSLCGNEEHIHGDACYSVKPEERLKTLICEEAVSEIHEHTDICFETLVIPEEKVLVCNVEEHKHDLRCYSDKEADLETVDTWEATLPDNNSGIWTVDLIAIARSQLGYSESVKNYEVTEIEEIKGYTRYGEWYGQPYADWSAIFISFCLNYAEIPVDVIPQNADCLEWITALKTSGIYKEVGQYVPKSGDLVFSSNTNSGIADRVGIISEVTKEDSSYKVIMGDLMNRVQEIEFGFNDANVVGYVELPNNLVENEEIQESNEPVKMMFAAAPIAIEDERIPAGTYNSFRLEYNDIKDAFIRDERYAPYYFNESPLGTAGSFHLVAFGTANLTTHTNGNILANTLIASSNFGTNNYPHELSYVMNYSRINGGSASGTTDHILVVGSNNELGFWDGQFYINQTKIDRPYNIIADQDSNNAPFIDLNRVEIEIAGISARLASVDNVGLRTSFTDQNNRYIELIDPNSTGYYSMKATDFSKYEHFDERTLKMRGFSSTGNGTIVINVDCTGVTEITLPDALVYIDGKEQGTNEVTEFSSGKVIWNFSNAEGVTIKTRRMTGMVIAPGATVTITRNLNGTVVAENINVEAESHRTDFTGDLDIYKVESEKAYVTIKKVDLDNFSSYLKGARFELQRWDKNSGSYVVEQRDVLETDQEGVLTITELDYNTAYRLIEVSAPSGYVNAGTIKDIYITHSDTRLYPIARPGDFSGSELNNGKVVYIANEKSTIPEQEFVSIEIKKEWYTRDGQLYEKDDGSISVAVCQKVYLDEDCRNFIREKDYNHFVIISAPNWSETITELPKDGLEVIDGTEQKVYYTYHVREQHVNGYATSYENNDGITEGRIVIKNQDIHIDYVLPETGGLGSDTYQRAGMILVMAAGVLFMIRKNYTSRRKFK